MKWVAGMLALLAVISGCVSLNKGSDQLALVDSGKGDANQPASSSPSAKKPAELFAAIATNSEGARDGLRGEKEVSAEIKATSLSVSTDLPGDRGTFRVVRASPPDPPRPLPPATGIEQALAALETKAVEPPAVAPPPANPVGGNDVKLPLMINGAAALAPMVQAAPVEAPAPRPTATAVRVVNTKRINLNYEIKDIGPSGVSTVELWYTQDGKKWEKSDTIARPRPPFVVDLKDEGLYGFTLVARNGVGLGKRPPAPGEQPQIWVEVDVTKPVVKLLDVQPGLVGDSQHLSICWKATDTNLGQRPISIAYAEQAAGPWMTIASNIENTGVYAWQLPAGAPPRFLLRVEAVDLAGNVGMAQTSDPILLDLSQPTVSILAVEPAGK